MSEKKTLNKFLSSNSRIEVNQIFMHFEQRFVDMEVMYAISFRSVYSKKSEITKYDCVKITIFICSIEQPK